MCSKAKTGRWGAARGWAQRGHPRPWRSCLVRREGVGWGSLSVVCRVLCALPKVQLSSERALMVVGLDPRLSSKGMEAFAKKAHIYAGFNYSQGSAHYPPKLAFVAAFSRPREKDRQRSEEARGWQPITEQQVESCCRCHFEVGVGVGHASRNVFQALAGSPPANAPWSSGGLPCGSPGPTPTLVRLRFFLTQPTLLATSEADFPHTHFFSG